MNPEWCCLYNYFPSEELCLNNCCWINLLLQVIEYVQFLQEKVQKYEGSYQGWSSEPMKLMPWAMALLRIAIFKNSHWRGQSFVDHPQAIKNDPGLGSTFSGKLDENNINLSPSMIASALDSSEADPVRDNEQAELAVPIQGGHPLQRPVSEAQATECLTSNDALNQQDDLTIEGGTISISSVYSQGLLNALTQALQRTGLDLSQANISVQIDLGKRSNRGLTSSAKSANGVDSNPVQKRLTK
ncbi:transcription factor BIM2 isoform X1 [Gossypium australe]|uniref:Transcription factor BIM2 isoform X1 n=1 Tax=Gossypium australe TaxID=47621 RepID=A0A5B6V0X7_9ROSI|nr:transcription factor BIM2 isoform X1 [Gossypium australe]